MSQVDWWIAGVSSKTRPCNSIGCFGMVGRAVKGLVETDRGERGSKSRRVPLYALDATLVRLAIPFSFIPPNSPSLAQARFMLFFLSLLPTSLLLLHNFHRSCFVNYTQLHNKTPSTLSLPLYLPIKAIVKSLQDAWRNYPRNAFNPRKARLGEAPRCEQHQQLHPCLEASDHRQGPTCQVGISNIGPNFLD